LAFLALAGYAANGAATHLHVAPGETIPVLICGDGANRVVELMLGADGPAEPARETCCGDCLLSHAKAADLPPMAMPPAPRTVTRRIMSGGANPTRPVLWPGAPPRGPPGAA